MTPRQVLEPAIHIARDGFALKPLVADLIGGLGPFFAAHWPSSAEVYLPGGVAPAGDELLRAARAGRHVRAHRRARRSRPAATASARSRRPGAPGTRASSPRRSTASSGRRSWTPPASAHRPADRPGPRAAGAPRSRSRVTLTTATTPSASRGRGRRARCSCSNSRCCAASISRRWIRSGRISSTRCRSAPSSRSPTATRSTATRGSPTCRSRRCYRRRTTRSGAGWSAMTRLARAAARARSPATADAWRCARGLDRRRRHPETAMDAETEAADDATWAQYVALTRGDTCHLDIIDRHGNMVSATPSGGWLSGSPVVPGLGFPVSVRGQMFSLDPAHPNAIAPGQAAAHDAHAVAGAARRRAVSGVRHAGRRPAGPVGAARLPAPCPPRPEPAGGDRRAELPHGAPGRLVLPARVPARSSGGGGRVLPRHAGRARPPRPPARDRRALGPLQLGDDGHACRPNAASRRQPRRQQSLAIGR